MDNEALLEINDRESSQVESVPRFSLQMLLAWVAITAGLFEFWRETHPRLDNQVGLMLGLTTIRLTVWSLGLCGLGFRVWWWKHERKIPWQPGHWLLCLAGCLGLLEILSVLSDAAFWRVDPFPGPTGFWIQTNFHYLFSIGALVVVWGVVIFAPMGKAWRLAILPLALQRTLGLGFQVAFSMFGIIINPSTGSVATILLWTHGILSLISPIPIMFLAIRDVATKTPQRDWMHWVGVAAWILLVLSPVVANLLFPLML
ncbi:hypothetical protein [Blastopirellula marina]|uniref:Uncharacterized protein n=1 Tax=Blastopirellula marina TaxID=124 RepID=A0A2S8GPG6_9BACT|nr:hypothetical protein [Blastopirellula marina]PQO46317.1 hypothetical protein C5Y93_10055 [Blastopirellula marina]